MSQFPVLKTGAVAQYPAGKVISFATRVFRFMGGEEQRILDQKAALRRWTIRLDLLDDAEIASIESFFRSNAGRYGTFAFTDPWDGAVYPNCTLEDDSVDLRLDGMHNASAVLTVRQLWS